MKGNYFVKSEQIGVVDDRKKEQQQSEVTEVESISALRLARLGRKVVRRYE